MTLYDTEFALEILKETQDMLTSREYLRLVVAKLGVSAFRAKQIVKTLVDHQEICYESVYGATMVRLSFAKPVKMTEHFFIKPPDLASHAGPLEIDINIFPGISFGSGSHPTTRLSLLAIDWLFYSNHVPCDLTLAGDIGTGSGVLAIAMCKCGIKNCLAWDIDANAVFEAEKNIQANDLTHRIRVIQESISIGSENFSVICANLRLPTLKQLAPVLSRLIIPSGILIASGILREEVSDFIECYGKSGFLPVWKDCEKKWAGLVLQNSGRKSFLK